MQTEITPIIEQRLKTLQIIVGAVLMSLPAYVGIALFLLEQNAITPMVIPSILPPAITAVAVSTVFGAGVVVKMMVERAQTLTTPSDRLGPYQSAVIVGVALRESAGVMGLVLTMLTGDIIWVIALSALAAVTIIATFPRRSALERLMTEIPPIG